MTDEAKMMTPIRRGETPCEACEQPTDSGRICGMCWTKLPENIKDAVWDAEEAGVPEFLRVYDIAVKVAQMARVYP